MYILILILPFTSFLFLSCFGYFLSKKDLLISSITLIILAWCCSLVILYEVNIGLSICTLNLGSFFNLTFLYCPILLLYDEVCTFMCFIVLSISCLVHYYSIEYMKFDLFICRFISYLSLFTFFMLVLVTSGTILQLFIGWEGVGLSPYLLINFWFTRIQASKAALKAVIMNRFGDIGLYGVMIILINWYGSFDFSSLSILFQYDIIYSLSNHPMYTFNLLGAMCLEFLYMSKNFDFITLDNLMQFGLLNNLDLILFNKHFQYWLSYIDNIGDFWYCIDADRLSYNYNKSMIYSLSSDKKLEKQLPNWIVEVLGFCILLAAIGKSAQIGLHTWLPDATEGPTPVSALIHAATMVTAGVFILIRFYFILENLSWLLICISIIGAVTVFFAGSVGSFQYDLKKVIAYSTCSQLGYMVFACGLSDYGTSLFHLINHAFFKALLLLGAGAVIHAIIDEQDMRKMGGLYKYIPLTYISISFSSLALIGIPFLSGFYSKDILLENAFVNLRIDAIIGYILCLIGIIFTTIYSIKLLLFVFFNGNNLNKISLNIHDAGFEISLILIILVILSICGGFIMKEWVFLSCCIYNFWISENIIAGEFLFLIIKNLPFTLIFLSLILCSIFWNQWTLIIYYYHFFNQKWYFDLIYNNFIIWFGINFSYFISFKLIDRAILEYWGSIGFSKIANISFKIQENSTGYIYHYMFIIWNFCIWLFFF